MQRVLITCGLSLAMLPVGAALADAVPGVSDVILRMEASNNAGSTALEFTDAELQPDGPGKWTWQVGTLPLFDDENDLIATLQNAGIVLFLQPGRNEIQFNFSVQSGSMGDPGDTLFSFQLPELTFPTIPADLMEGNVSVAFNGTDVTGDGYMMSEVGASGTGIYRAYINRSDGPGALFSNLVSEMSNGPFGSITAWGSYSGDSNGVDVYSSDVEIDFTLSENDIAGGNSTIRITPEPSSLGLLAAGLLVLIRRR